MYSFIYHLITELSKWAHWKRVFFSLRTIGFKYIQLHITIIGSFIKEFQIKLNKLWAIITFIFLTLISSLLEVFFAKDGNFVYSLLVLTPP